MNKFLFLFFAFSFSALGQVREVQSALNFVERGPITIDRTWRSPASVDLNQEMDKFSDGEFYRREPASEKSDEENHTLRGLNFTQYFYKDGLIQKPVGFDILMTGPNQLAKAPIDSKEKISRKWQFVTQQGSQRETYLKITDDAGTGFLSQLMETIIVVIPRIQRPVLTVTNNELSATLTSGEKIIFDQKTGLIKSGVILEGPIDTNPNRHSRQFVPLKYSGSGIMIRIDKRGGDPRVSDEKAIISQNGKSCEAPTTEFWNQNLDFKFSDDNALVKHLNHLCDFKFTI